MGTICVVGWALNDTAGSFSDHQSELSFSIHLKLFFGVGVGSVKNDLTHIHTFAISTIHTVACFPVEGRMFMVI